MFKNKKGVFGLTAVQSFFAIILGIALLAYVIVIIMGTLGDSNILTEASYNVTNESYASSKSTGAVFTLHGENRSRVSSCVLWKVVNGTTDPKNIAVGNFTVTGCSVTNATETTDFDTTLKFSYTFGASSAAQNRLDDITDNTSTGISGFFSSINPVYAILAVLVIILVLVVLVRVVQAPNAQSRPEQL